MIYIYSHLVRVENGGEGLLDRDGVPGGHTLPGHHVPPHPSLVLHLHIIIIIIIIIITTLIPYLDPAAEAAHLLVGAAGQLGHHRHLPLLHGDALPRQLGAAADGRLDLPQRGHRPRRLLLLELGLVRLEALLGAGESRLGEVELAEEEVALGAALVQLVAQLLGVAAAQRKLDVLKTAFNISKVVEAGRSKNRRIISKLLIN